MVCDRDGMVCFSGDTYIDEVSAFYIGAEKDKWYSNSGYLLYNLAEQVGELFGQTGDVESWVNQEFMLLLNYIKINFISNDVCTVTL